MRHATAVPKEERRAYEAGRREAETIGEAPLAHMISRSERPSDPDLREAYDEGLKGEQLDED
jgi:hypothetical protein